MPETGSKDSSRPDDAIPWTTALKLRLSAIVWFLLALGCLLALPVLFDATALIVIAAAILALLIGALAAWLYRRFFKRSSTSGFSSTWIKASLAGFFVLCIALAAPLYYFAIETATRPALLPRVTLTDGKKTVIFQGMMHIGSEQFYKSVVYDAEKALSEGYVLYYEGVQPNPAADKWFSDNMAGGGDLGENYKLLSEVCGLKFQLDYFKLLEKDFDKHPDLHIKADVDALDMKREYERLMKSDPEFAAAMNDGYTRKKLESTASTASTIEWLKKLTKDQKKLAGYVCRWMLNKTDLGQDDTEKDQMKKVIREFRNVKLAERILAADHDKIYITYGAAHIPGVIKILKQSTPAWTIEATSWARPIDAPRHFERQL